MALQEIGCLFGALANLWLGDRLGRRKTIFIGGSIMIVGAILQTTSFTYAQMIVARIITGLGNGLNVSCFREVRGNLEIDSIGAPDVNSPIVSRRVFTSREKRQLYHG